ncbi:hypothetical protein GCM10007989_30840 [Devosia pacifica]|uniref:DUF4214 domain-containing protein n=1 Tax=Devosia pacifica TaxID=1335967 RepID=A0A918VWX1_9HYPH|nr:DUF4214 domain-containing protein [Devosia pacifica]GHA32570.1 hypothetical protein GCM10007989_30840 [Devosia pacifica]
MASVQGVYIAIFGRPADPVGLAYWNEVTDNGQNLSQMIAAFTDAPEFEERFAGQSNSEIVTAIYQALFGREPDAEGLAFYTDALDNGTLPIETIAINILDGAQNEDAQIIQNKEAAADVFTASLDTPEEIAAYSGANAEAYGQQFLNQVTADPDSVPTGEEIEEAIEEVLALPPEGQTPPDEGEAPAPGGGGGGGGGGTPTPLATLEDGVLTIQKAATLSTVNGDWMLAAGNQSVTLTPDEVAEVTEIALTGASVQLNAHAAALHEKNLEVTGAGQLNITGLTIDEAEVGSPLEANYELEGVIPNIEVPFLVNNSEADAIKAAWDIWDDQYVKAREEDSQEGYYVDEINAGMIETGIRYVGYLENGGEPFTDFGAKVTNSRDQSLHDNLLGNLNKDSLMGRNLPDDVETEFLERIPDDYEARPVFSGNDSAYGSATHDAVRVFDYNKGWDRSDYLIDVDDGGLDPAALNGDNMWVGSGIPGEGDFVIARHEGAGIELAIRARDRFDADVTNEGGGNFQAEGGVYIRQSDGAEFAEWSFDFSIATGLNGSESSLSDFTFELYFDLDATESTSFIFAELTDLDALSGESDGTFEAFRIVNADDFSLQDAQAVWNAPDLLLFVDNVGETDAVGGAQVAQNSQNYHFGFVEEFLQAYSSKTYGQEWDYEDGVFTIGLNAIDANGSVVANSEMQVFVGMGGASAFDDNLVA